MKSESKLLIELWDAVRDQIQPARRLETALSFIRTFEENGMDERDLQDVLDEDAYLTRAYREVFDLEENHNDGGEDE
ncbi:MAG: hypothetical protein EOP83_08430 [Verrucomicrobiaceae bacterium]|nr:MAG: hypothetical protein EOP83_08430 [Verrucomicrobiaceae bacterium]